MGKTVPSYRLALEDEIARWKGFREALPSEEEQKAFDDLMDMCRAYVHRFVSPKNHQQNREKTQHPKNTAEN